jgi:predicted O-methyltransferase YrrM
MHRETLHGLNAQPSPPTPLRPAAPTLQVWAPAEEHDEVTAGLVALTDKIASDKRVAMDLLPVGDGVLLCRKL